MSTGKPEVKPYDSEGNKKSQVSRMFNSIAPYYDLLNRVLSLGIDRIWRDDLLPARLYLRHW